MHRHPHLLAPLLVLLPAVPEDPPIPIEPAYKGAAVAYAGDVDLDGSGDVIVGAWWDESGKDRGSATIFSGKTGKRLLVVRGSGEGTLFGIAVAGGGDCNGDGTPDFAVGAPLEKVGGKVCGAVTVYSGREAKVLFRLQGDSEEERFGWSVAMPRDANLDGNADVAVGAPRSSTPKAARTGEVRLFNGKTGKPLQSWKGAGEGDELGDSVASAGDVNADGASDVLASSWRAGYVWVLSGKDGKPLHELRGIGTGERFGWCARGAGDTSQSGSDDVLVGVPGGAKDRAQLFDGKSGKLRRGFAPVGKEGAEAFGFGLALDGAGDVNADGFADVVVADPGGPSALCDVTGTPLGGSFEKLLEPTARPGGVYVYSGHEGDLLYELHGEAKNDRFGVSVASAGDADQDGFGDLVVGAGRGLPYVARIHAGPKGKLLHALVLEK